jgi:hypothetical protein
VSAGAGPGQDGTGEQHEERRADIHGEESFSFVAVAA